MKISDLSSDETLYNALFLLQFPASSGLNNDSKFILCCIISLYNQVDYNEYVTTLLYWPQA